MGLPFIREFRLAGPEGDGRHAYLNDGGAFLGDGTPLIEKDEAGRWRPRSQHDLEKLLSEGYGIEIDLASRMSRLQSVANGLNKSDRSLALIALANVEFPALPEHGAERMAKLDCDLRKYDPSQPRAPEGSSDGGQWVSAGASAETSARALAMGALTLGGAGGIRGGAGTAAAFAAASVFGERIGTIIRNGTGPRDETGPIRAKEGKLRQNPEVSFRFDDGALTLYDFDEGGNAEILFSERAEPNGGFYRTSEGTVIGRRVGEDGFLINDNADTILYAERLKSRAKERSAVQAKTEARDRDKPEVCPNPVPDRPGGRSIPSLEYEGHIHGLTNPGPRQLKPGEAVRLVNPETSRHVYYDDCQRSTNVMVEAKGVGYADRLLRWGPTVQAGISWKFLRQAERQIKAANGRPIEWHFAEKEAADFTRNLFKRWNMDIAVIHTPLPGGKR